MQGMQSRNNATRMEERFEESYKKKFPPHQKNSISGIIYGAFGEKIKNWLKNPELFSKEFRHYHNWEEFPRIWNTVHVVHVRSRMIFSYFFFG